MAFRIPTPKQPLDFLVGEEVIEETATLTGSAWAEAGPLASWCRFMGAEDLFTDFLQDLRRSGSIKAGKREHMVEAIKAPSSSVMPIPLGGKSQEHQEQAPQGKPNPWMAR